MMIEELWELVDDLRRRADNCAQLADTPLANEIRLLGKAKAYAHAADLLADELRRQGA